MVMKTALSIDKVNKKYADGSHAVADVSFDVAEGETLCLLGTSGCGKTTLLKMINRLIEPTSGTIRVGGRDTREWDIIELRRSIGYVIQSIGLFPHMTIYDNVALVPRLKAWPEKEVRERVHNLLAMVNLDPAQFSARYPGELSGGQQQRVGVIRALAADPGIILMDEPFGALDPITRTQIQDEFLQIRERLGKTIVIVTHDLAEAIKLADRIALIDRGSVVQLDTPAHLLEKPSSPFVKNFFALHRGHRLPDSLRASDIARPALEGACAEAPCIDADMPLSEVIAVFLSQKGAVLSVKNDGGIIDGEAIAHVFAKEFWDRERGISGAGKHDE
jgi:osmoprotectant transport system ATP-binding protein